MDEALETLKRAVESFPKDPSARTAYGDALLAKGDLDGALAQYEQRLELEPTTDAREATKKDPAQLEARSELGFLYLRGGDKEKAVKVLGEVLAVEPRHSLALLYLGHTLYQRGDAKEAEQSFRGAAQVAPTFGEPHYALGQLLEAAGKLPEAKAAYEKAAELQKDHPDAAASARRLSSAK